MKQVLDLSIQNPFSNPFTLTYPQCERNLLESNGNSKFDSQSDKYFAQAKRIPVVPSRNIAFASTGGGGVEYGSTTYYLLCALGGILSCGTTHTGILPLDLVKCRMQVDPVKYPSLVKGLKTSVNLDGTLGLFKGWVPTAIGYGLQGMAKFGLYEVFKKKYGDAVGPELFRNYTAFVWLAASASAEFFADILLSPFEALKVRIQTVPGFPTTMRGGIPEIMSKEGFGGFYKSLVPLWGRQIPYTMVKFASFEKTVNLIYEHVFPKPRSQATKGEKLLVTFTSGYIAGVFCGVVSHPADTMVSKLQEKGTTISSVYKKIGFSGLWKGLGPRIIMIGTLTAAQWFIYDAVKVTFQLPPPPAP